ncbi:MAG TPA: F-box-like domain-containing protein [Longimicrobium sp.]
MDTMMVAETQVDEVPDIILPPEILDLVLGYLDIKSLVAASQVNKRWNSVARADGAIAPRIYEILSHPRIQEFAAVASQTGLVSSNYHSLLNIYVLFTQEILAAVPPSDLNLVKHWVRDLTRFTPTKDGHDAVHKLITHNGHLSVQINLGGFACSLGDALFLRACMSTFIYHGGGDSYFVKKMKFILSYLN